MVFGAHNEQLAIRFSLERARDGGEKARPSGSAVELHVGSEQGLSTSGTHIGSLALLAVERAGKRALGTLFPEHAILIGRQRAFPVTARVAAALVVFVLVHVSPPQQE